MMNTNNPDDLLMFKDFEEFPNMQDSYSQSGSAKITINSPTKKNYSADASPDTGPDTDVTSKTKAHSFFSIEFYQQFFDVDTMMVVERIVNSIFPKRAPANYLKLNIGTNPDLYGPFWIVVTLIFTIAISGNIANYLQHASTDYHWRYNFHLVSIAASSIIFYVCFVPCALWGILKWSAKTEEEDTIDPDAETGPFTPSLLSLICVYGYSLAVYIPVSVLWTIQFSLLQWLLVSTAAFLSGSVLIFVMQPALRYSKYSLIIMVSIVVAHFILAAGFMLYFFHVPASNLKEHVAIAIAATPAPAMHKNTTH